MEFIERETVPCELGNEEVAGKGVDVVAGEGGAERNGSGGVEEEKSWNSEKDDEEQSGTETGLGRGNGFLGFGVEGHVGEKIIGRGGGIESWKDVCLDVFKKIQENYVGKLMTKVKGERWGVGGTH